jgi:hypothetical protein
LATQPAAAEVGFDYTKSVCSNDAGVTLDEIVPAGFAGAPWFEGKTMFEMEYVQGEQEFDSRDVGEPSFADLQDLLLKTYKAEKTPIEWC